MALPDLPVQGQNPWYTDRNNFDTAIEEALEGRLSADGLARSTATVNVADAPFGAIPLNQNSGAGQNAAIQAAIDHVATLGGGTVVVDNDYWIRADDPNAPAGNFLGDYGGIALKDGVHLQMTSTGVLRALPSPEGRYIIVRIYNKKNVTVSGGRVIGERDLHVGSVGEWGYNIAITGGENITIQGVNTSKAWGDGVNIQRYNPGGGNPVQVPKNIQILDVVSDGNRRQGMSIEAGDGIVVRGGSYRNTSGTLPQAGIDIEPVDNVTICKNIRVTGVDLSNNARWGLAVFMNGTSNVVVENCVFNANLEVTQLHIQTTGQDVTVRNCIFTASNTYCAIVQGGTGRRFLGNSFDKRVLFSLHPDGSSICRDITVRDNRFSYTSATVGTGALLEFHQYSKFAEVVNNLFEYTGGTRGIGVWIRYYPTSAGASEHYSFRGNTLINCTNAFLTGAVSQITLAGNEIHACSDYAIRSTPTNGLIANNRVTGANLVSNFAAIWLENGTGSTLVEGNKIERDPAVTVGESRRGDTGITFGTSVLNTVVRSTHLTNIAARYSGYPTTHTDTYLETTPGSWYVWP